MRVIKFRGKVGGNWWYVTPDDDAWEQFWAIVDRKTVGEYTDITDKNNKEMYEGDICLLMNKVTREPYRIPYEVYFTGGSYEARDLQGNPYDNGEYRWTIVDWNDCEIIGNIHDNLMRAETEQGREQ